MKFQRRAQFFWPIIALMLAAHFGGVSAKDAQEEESQIYSEVLNHLVRSIPKNERISVVVSSDSMSMQQAYREISQNPPSSLQEDLTRRLRRAKKDTVRNFADKSAARQSVQFSPALLSTKVAATLVPRAGIDEIFKENDAGNWERFAKRYSGARYLIYFSPIGFDAARREALVYIHRTCVGLCGSGELVLLRQAKGRWSVREVRQFWIS